MDEKNLPQMNLFSIFFIHIMKRVMMFLFISIPKIQRQHILSFEFRNS